MKIINNFKARIGDVGKCIDSNGVFETFKLAYSTIADLGFDKKNGLRTMEPSYVAKPILMNGKTVDGSFYLPTRAAPFMEFLRRRNFSKASTFVDIGCGKGRVLWLARQFGFEKVVGIEIDRELAGIAKQNLESKGLIEGVDFEVHAMNAAEFELQADSCIYFFYGPYISDSDLMKTLEFLRRKKSITGLEQFFVFHCNILRTTPLDKTDFLKVGDEKILGNRFFVYKTP